MSKSDTENAKHELAKAVSDAVKLLSIEAQEATKKIAQAAEAAAKVVSVKDGNDHDFILTFSATVNAKLDNIDTKITDLATGTSKRIDNLEKEKLNTCDSYLALYKKDVEDKLADHEKRIKCGEITDTRLISYGTALVFILSFAQWIIGKYF